MSVLKLLDTESVVMISTIGNGYPTNTINLKRRKNGHEGTTVETLVL